jgi:hypothetical protein
LECTLYSKRFKFNYVPLRMHLFLNFYVKARILKKIRSENSVFFWFFYTIAWLGTFRNNKKYLLSNSIRISYYIMCLLKWFQNSPCKSEKNSRSKSYGIKSTAMKAVFMKKTVKHICVLCFGCLFGCIF